MTCVVGHSPLSLPAQAYCYSLQARRSYDFRALSGDRYGPGTSAFLDELEVWNIAFLTSAFESQDHILDIEIALCAYKTGHFVLSQQSVDEVDLASPELCVGGLFRLPAGRGGGRGRCLSWKSCRCTNCLGRSGWTP